MRKFLLSLIINIILFAPAFADYVKTKDLSLSAADITELEIDCGAGYLMVEGVEGLENIEVEAEIVIEGMNRKKAQDFIDKHLRLDIREKRGHAVLRSHFDKSLSSFTLFGRKSSMVNLNVRIPVDMDLTIDDGSGDTRVENINGEVTIDDGSGDLELELIKGHTDTGRRWLRRYPYPLCQTGCRDHRRQLRRCQYRPGRWTSYKIKSFASFA